MKEITDYENLRLDVLIKLIDLRSIPYKKYKKDNDTKKHIIELLKLDDVGKYIWETTYEKSEKGFIIGVDIRNEKHIKELSKLIEKKEAKFLDRYSDNRLQYWSLQKLT